MFSPIRFSISGRLRTDLKCCSISPRTFLFTVSNVSSGVTFAIRSPDDREVNPEVGSEYDKSFGKIDTVAATGGQNAVVENLEKFVEDPGVCLFDFVEQKDAEGFFPDGVGEFTSHIVSDVAWGRADQPLIGMLRAEFRHVETDVSAIVSEQQAGDRLCKFRFSDTGRPARNATPRGRPPRGDWPIPVTARLTISSIWVTAWA